MEKYDAELWHRSLARVKREVAELPAGERAWVVGRLVAIARMQEEMHELVVAVGGETACRECQGSCCGHGKYHLTLVNLLPYMLGEEEPPPADFTCSCPFLGPAGCILPVARRPFNCLTFLCEQVEGNLTADHRRSFHALEAQLRELYLGFDRRYAGSSLRGLLNRAERLEADGRGFLDRL